MGRMELSRDAYRAKIAKEMGLDEIQQIDFEIERMESTMHRAIQVAELAEREKQFFERKRQRTGRPSRNAMN